MVADGVTRDLLWFARHEGLTYAAVSRLFGMPEWWMRDHVNGHTKRYSPRVAYVVTTVVNEARMGKCDPSTLVVRAAMRSRNVGDDALLPAAPIAKAVRTMRRHPYCMPQSDIARATNGGCSRRHLQDIEHGRCKLVHKRTARAILEGLSEARRAGGKDGPAPRP